MNQDLNLNFRNNYDTFLGVNGTNMHYFITGFDGRLYSHSKVTLSGENDSITMAEFSKTDIPLKEELYTKETKKFNDTLLPLMKDLNSTVLTSYNRWGKYLAALTPINLKYFAEEGSDKYGIRRTFVLVQVVNMGTFLKAITDKSGLYLLLIIWTTTFTATFILLIFFSA